MGGKVNKKIKTDAMALGQKRHNRATRGINTFRQGVLWAHRRFKTKDDDGNEVEDSYDVRVPPNTLWNPYDKQRNDRMAAEPFDALSLDWRREIQYYASERRAKIDSIKLSDGRYRHVVHNNGEILFELNSCSKLTFGPKRRRRNKRKA